MGKGTSCDEIETLRKNVEWALRNSPEVEEILPLLDKLARNAEPESDAWLLAHRHLAELSVDRSPWRSALFATRVVKVDPDDDSAWAVLGLAQTLMGNYRSALSAYRRAVDLAPDNPWYLHNLGHLLDAALNRPKEALPLLAEAYDSEPDQNEIAASYAHALARSGKLAQAKKLHRRVVDRGATKKELELWRFIEEKEPKSRSSRKSPAKATKKKATPGKSKKKVK